jgi:hypothetical protein
MIRTEMSVYAVPEVVAGMRPVTWKEIPDGAEMLTSLTCLHQSMQLSRARSADGRFYFEVESYGKSDEAISESRVTLRSDLGAAKFKWVSNLKWALGVPLVCEIGSFDGERTVFVVAQQDLVLIDGTLFDDWILKEDGGAFLLEERLVSLDGNSIDD